MSELAGENIEPFIGPRPFGESQDDRRRFKGRYFEAKRLVSYVFSQKVTLLYAPSGSGKTSLIQAAVIPELKRKGCDVLPVTRVQIASASSQYRDRVKNLYVFNALLRLLPRDANPAEVIDETIHSFVAKYPCSVTSETGDPIPRLLVFDQFEEMFTVPTKNWLQQREGFFEQVKEALEQNDMLRIMFAIREEYVGQLEKYGYMLPNGFSTRFRLGTLSTDNAELALTEPLKHTSRRFAEGVVQKIVADMAMIKWSSANEEVIEVEGDMIEPVHLQLVGSTLWQNLPDSVTTIQQEDVRQYGDVDKILQDYYEQAIENITSGFHIKEDKIRNWFDTCLITSIGTRSIVFRDMETTSGLDNKIIDRLSDTHIIRGEERAGGYWYELSHDRWIKPIREANANWRRGRAKQRQQRIIGSLLFLFVLSGTFVWYKYTTLNFETSIVPAPKGVEDRSFNILPKPEYGNFNVMRDIRVIDLRSRKKLKFWQHKLGGKYSPVTWLRYTLARKKKGHENTQEMVFRFATSGYEVIPRSLTHEYWLATSVTDKSIHPNETLNMVRHVNADVSKEKDNDFLVVTEATYWNAFQGEKEWASITAVDKHARAIGVSVIFPRNNLHTQVTLRKHNVHTKEKVEIAWIDTTKKESERSPQERVRGMRSGEQKIGRDGELYELFLDDLSRTIYWLINKPDINYRYDVGWVWDEGRTLKD